jgi:glycosyltransferase involved in cell wall biosynthesis
MRFVFAAYEYTGEFDQPAQWLDRISAFTGILSALAKANEVHSIQQINFKGSHHLEGVAYHFKHYPKLALRFFPLQLNLYLKNLKPDVIVIQGFHCPLRIIQLRLLLGPKVKIMVQHRAEKPLRGYKKVFQQLADRCVNAYLFGSQSLGTEWVRLGNLKSPQKIHEVAGLSSRFHPIAKTIAQQHTKAIGNPIYLWAGRLNENKNPITVVTAFLRFTEISPNAQLYMAYQTTELLHEIEKMLQHHLHGKQVTLIGDIAHQDLLYWFNLADFMISGSYYEGGGTVITEALSAGCTPIVTSIPSFKMLTNHGEVGFLYTPGNVDELFEILEETQQLKLAGQREKCLAFFKAHLSFETIGHKIQEIASAL